MECVVPWAALVELIAPYDPEGKNGRPPFAQETILCIHFMQQWFSLSDPAMEEAFFDTPLYREFAQLDAHGRLPDESTILRLGKTPSPHHRLEKHKLADRILASVNDLLTAQGLLLKAGTAVDATLIPAPSCTKNKGKARDPEMHSSQKGKQWYFGMKATGTSREVNVAPFLFSFALHQFVGHDHDLLETWNRLHIYSRAYCTVCGPRYQPLSRTPFTLRGINLIHLPSFEFPHCRSDLFKASCISRLAKNGQRKLRHWQLRWRHDQRRKGAADVMSVIPLLSRHDRP